MAVASLAVLIGTSAPVEPAADLEQLSRLVDLSMISKGPAKFDPADLDGLNARLIHALPFEAVADRLDALGITGGAAFWEAVKGNLVRLAEAADWWGVVTGPIAPAPIAPEDIPFIAAAEAALPAEPFDAGTWKLWTDQLKAETGRKGKALFLPLRRALTGLDHGPETAALLPLIGRSSTMARLAAQRLAPEA